MAKRKNQQLKILIFNHNQERFGTYFRCYSIADGLSQIGYKVTMICASGRDFDFRVRKQQINPNFLLITLPRVKYHTYHTGQITLRLPLYLYFALTGSYDLFYAFTVAQPQIAIPAVIGKFLKRKKLIIDWDDLWGGGFASLHVKPVEWVLTWSERFFLRFADVVTCASQKLYQNSLRLGIVPQKLFIVPNGCNSSEDRRVDQLLAKKKLKLPVEEKVVLSMGNTYNSITLNLLFEAYESLRKKFSKVKLIFLSSLVLSDVIKERYKKIMENITLTGFVSEGEKYLYLSAADVLALPMEDNPVEEARFPIRFGDYLCAGRPIVSNAVGEVKYYLEKYNAGLTSPPASPKEFGDNILRVLKDKKLAGSLSKNARKLAEEDLSRESVIKKIDALIRSLF